MSSCQLFTFFFFEYLFCDDRVHFVIETDVSNMMQVDQQKKNVLFT